VTPAGDDVDIYIFLNDTIISACKEDIEFRIIDGPFKGDATPMSDVFD